jgi:predicted dehydrogenase
MADVRVGIVGCGGIGCHHAKQITSGKVNGLELAAICEADPGTRERVLKEFGEDLKSFDNLDAFLGSGAVDAIIVATPHYEHTRITIAALKAGLHVMCEKPAGVYTKQVREMNAVADESELMFGLMFQQRLNETHIRLKDLLESGEIGAMKRMNWTVTSWYRSQSYFDSGGWRATWAGEGGGVLINQSPHQLDLWQWFCGMPKRVRAFCSFGKYHDIEVEDDVLAYVEYENGATGSFITSTGETPGTNRLEIAGNNGRIVMEGGKLVFDRTRVSERQFNSEFKGGFGEPEIWKCDIPTSSSDDNHAGVLDAWGKAIQANDSSLMVAKGQEGIRGVELANAMLLSTWIDDWVDLPIDEDLFFGKLEEKIETSRFVKKTVATEMNIDASF